AIIYEYISCELVYLLVLSSFFFQAEDGIRDDLVTGVQTCALPISAHRGGRDVRGFGAADDRAGLGNAGAGTDAGDPSAVRAGDRSEERRVGKECRERWAPCR